MTYAKLETHFRRVGQLEEIAAIAGWDQAVNMPDAAAESRAQSLSELTRVIHDLVSEPRIDDWLEQAATDTGLSAWQRANVREIRARHRRAVAVPAELVQASAHADKVSEQAWRSYRAENNFAAFEPYLSKVLSLKREVAAHLASAFDCSMYEALAQEFEPGIRVPEIEQAFEPLREFLPGFTAQVIEAQRQQPLSALIGPYPVETQRALGLELMQAIGFAMDRGRLDVSHHPFCGGVPDDVRITTRYDRDNFTSALMGVLHEAGHAKYEQGLPQVWRHQPVGVARGMVIHESQSLLHEMQISRGRPFLSFALPKIRHAFAELVSENPVAYTADNLAALYTRVQSSLIRVDADEVTYPCHVLLRYDLDRRLIDGSLAVRELPEAWDAQMKHYLGLSTLGNDRDGCMQDVHWPSGSFGYFPLYTLGAMVAAQLFAALRSQHPDVDAEIERGDWGSVNAWLSRAVWSRASSISTREIVLDATGEPLSARCFIEHLKRRYQA